MTDRTRPGRCSPTTGLRRRVVALRVGVGLAVVACVGDTTADRATDRATDGAPDGSANTPAAPATAASEDWPADAVIYHVFLDRFADGDDLTAGGTAPSGTRSTTAHATPH